MLMLRSHPHPSTSGFGDGLSLTSSHGLVGDSTGYNPFLTEQPPFSHSCILEMRKEKSRDAARSRRGKENYEFYELAKMLPLPSAITSQLDKASIIRLTISFLKLRDFSSIGDPPWGRDGPSATKILKGAPIRARTIQDLAMTIFEQHQGTHILQSLDGFAFVVSSDCRFLYISETVSIYLGLSQVEMTGSSVFDYVHQQDHAELAEQLGVNLSQSHSVSSPGSVGSDDGSCSASGDASTPTGLDRPAPVMTLNSSNSYRDLERSFCVRMKSTLTKRGCHFKSTGYRVVLVLCHLRPHCMFPHNRKQPPTLIGMVALAIALPPPSVHEVRLENGMFVTRLSFDFKIAHCEPRIAELLDFTAEELVGKNMYSLCHGQDVQQLRKCHIDLIHKGQVMSGYYRLMNKNGGFTWLQTCATVICNNKNSEEQAIICVNYVLSGIEYENCIMDCSQLTHTTDLQPDDSNHSERESPDKDHQDDMLPEDSEPRLSPKPRDGRSSTGGDSSNQDQLTQMSGGNKHPDNLRPVGEGFLLRNQQPSELHMEEEQLDLTIEPSSFPEDHPVASIGSPTERSSTSRKRKFSGGSTSHSAQSELSRSRPGSTSSLRSSSPLANGSFLPNGATNKSFSPDGQVPSASVEERISPRTSKKGRESVEEVQRPWKRSPVPPFGAYSGTNGSSAMTVKELEDVMNKHLPNSQIPGIVGTVAPPHGSPTQEMMASRMAHSPQSHQQYRSTIQWIGGSQTTLPATTLLRQLYVNRESVIRSGAHASRPSYYGEVQGALPTPPGSSTDGSYSDQTQFMLPAKMAAESYGVLSGYSTTPVNVSNYMDTYSAMTPPASVSPREKFPGIVESQTFSDTASLPHMRHYVSESPLQHLPLKPQVFVHPGTIDPSAYSHTHAQQSMSHEQRQLYAHHSRSFHLYHPPGGGKPTHSNTTAWYPQPSS
ncbi:protein trachealess-like isoform X3 [Tachypleus tridentatus]|uniref:protein trachealess-like isoform X3 n=1 Tax=Tachypleus tridentatus TaxID=6853 RepID=UPI003FD36854